jgi:DNA-binding MarR family transcriptional regulator
MEQLNETLLKAWMKLSSSVINPRVVAELSYKESQVCHILYHNYLKDPASRLTATDLCLQTKMLKSQMNRTLNLLEEKGIIVRERNSRDKRQVYVTMNWEGADKYRVQHERILKLVDGIIERLGKEQAEQTALLMTQIADIADDFLSEK